MKYIKIVKWVTLLTGMISLAGWATEIETEKPEDWDKFHTYKNIRYHGLYSDDVKIITEEKVDDQPLWRLFKAKKYAQLESLIKENPERTVPEDLAAGMVGVKIMQAKNQADNKHLWTEVINLVDVYPDHFSCENIYNMWALADAYYALSQTKQLISLYHRILNECLDPHSRFITLQQASTHLSHEQIIEMVKLESYKPLLDSDRIKLDKFIYDIHAGWLASAMRRNALTEGQKASSYLKARVLKRQDHARARLMGWWSMHNGNIDSAQQWFDYAQSWRPTGDAAYGIGLIHIKSGREKEAIALAKKWADKEPRLLGLVLGLEAEQASSAYKNKQYERSLLLSRSVLNFAKNRSTQKILHSMKTIEAWSLYHLNRHKEAANSFTEAYTTKQNIESAEGLVLSLIELGEFQQVVNIASQLKGPLAVVLGATPKTGENKLYYQFYSGWMNYAAGNADYPFAKQSGARISSLIIERKDHEAALTLGWSYLKSNEEKQAEQWFIHSLEWKRTENAAHGLASAWKKLGNFKGAERLAKEWGDTSLPLRQLHSELILDKADQAYKQGNFSHSLHLSKKSVKLVDSDRAVELSAWSNFRLGNKQVATDDFEQLYRRTSSKKIADGLLTIGLESNLEYQLNSLADELGEPLASDLSLRMSERYYRRDFFIQAEKAGAIEKHPELKNIDSWSVAVQPYARHRSGEKGLGLMDTVGNVFQFKGSAGLHQFGLDLDFQYLDSDKPATTARLGTLANSWATMPTDSAEALIEPIFSYRYESILIPNFSLVPYFSVGSTPIGGQVDSTWVGSVGLNARNSSNFWNWNIELFADSVQESILSTSGIVDPYTGQSWGRVVEYGVEAISRFTFGDWQLSLNGAFSSLQGHHVEDNTHFKAGIGSGYSFDIEGFDYFVLGPRYRYQHFKNNQRFFTLGHGGYFSPSALHAAELALNFQTNEGKQFVLAGQGALGYQYTSEDDAFAFPLSNTGAIFNGDDNSGVVFHTRLTGIYRITDYLQLGGFFNVIQSAEFTDVGGGLMLRYIFKPRPAVYSTDLPDIPWNE